MTDPNSYAALSFLLYVIGICALLAMAYTAIDWLHDRWVSIQYDRKREIERLQDEITRLEKKNAN